MKHAFFSNSIEFVLGGALLAACASTRGLVQYTGFHRADRGFAPPRRSRRAESGGRKPGDPGRSAG